MKLMFWKIFCPLFAWTLAFPAISVAQGAPITAAYNRLRLFNSRVDSGISYVNFRSEWGDVRGQIDIAIQDSKPSELTQKLDEIRTTYTEAAQFWYCLIEVRYLSLMKLCLGGRPPSSSPVIGPGLMKILNESGGSTLETRHVVSSLVPLYFKLADAQTQQLGALLRGR
jgi:hypothetical protein